jgi:hypothetical protein
MYTCQAVGPAGQQLEILLDPVADLAGHLGGVFLRVDHRERSAHQPHVVVFTVGLLRDGVSRAVVPGTGRPGRRARDDPLAGGAALAVRVGRQEQALGVDAVARIRLPRGQSIPARLR